MNRTHFFCAKGQVITEWLASRVLTLSSCMLYGSKISVWCGNPRVLSKSGFSFLSNGVEPIPLRAGGHLGEVDTNYLILCHLPRRRHITHNFHDKSRVEFLENRSGGALAVTNFETLVWWPQLKETGANSGNPAGIDKKVRLDCRIRTA